MHCAKLEGGAGLKGLIKEKKVVYFKKIFQNFIFYFMKFQNVKHFLVNCLNPIQIIHFRGI